MNIEKILEKHYINLRDLKRFGQRLEDAKAKIEEYKFNLNENKFNLETDIKAQTYSDNITGKGGKPASKVEQELERKINQFEKYIEHYIREENYCIDKIFNIEIDIKEVDSVLKDLEEEDLKLIELRYKDKLKYSKIANLHFQGIERTAYRKFKEIIKRVALKM